MSVAMKWYDEKGFEEVDLWIAARKLYGDHGFILVEESSSLKWGKELMVQHFVRKG